MRCCLLGRSSFPPRRKHGAAIPPEQTLLCLHRSWCLPQTAPGTWSLLLCGAAARHPHVVFQHWLRRKLFVLISHLCPSLLNHQSPNHSYQKEDRRDSHWNMRMHWISPDRWHFFDFHYFPILSHFLKINNFILATQTILVYVAWTQEWCGVIPGHGVRRINSSPCLCVLHLLDQLSAVGSLLRCSFFVVRTKGLFYVKT